MTLNRSNVTNLAELEDLVWQLLEAMHSDIQRNDSRVIKFLTGKSAMNEALCAIVGLYQDEE